MRRVVPRPGPAFAIAVLAAALAGCVSEAPPPAAIAPASLATKVVRPAKTPLERTVDGTIEAVNQATVSAQTSGRVVEIYYDVGDVVPAGAVIMRLKGTEQRAGLTAATASLTEAKARAAEAQTNWQRISDMYQRRVVSKAQYDQATANRDAAAARLAAAEAAVASAREGVGYTEIRAPYGGVVTRRLVEIGETVSPGTPLMTGLSLENLRVNTYVPQSVAAQVRRYGKAAVYADGKRVESTKLTIFPEAATASGTFRARVELPKGALALEPGMYVKVGLVIGEAERLTVPATALVRRSEVTAVYVVDEKGVVSLRYVRPGNRFGDEVEILSGLVAGEKVALDPVAAARVVTGGAKS
jgi:RND family efflux transporter MFP subunit